jgi:hypothetical protein
MKTILTLFLFLSIVTASLAAGIEGTWKGNMQGPDGDGMEMIFVFKMEGGKLTGIVKSPQGDMPVTVTQKNEKEFSFEVNMMDMTIKHELTLKDDGTLSMKVVGSPMGDTEIILKRQE